jgi:uncharacterized protein
MKHALAVAIGLSLAGKPYLAVAADYAPLDCAKAKSAAEITICKTYTLGQSEARMATLYDVVTSLVAMGQRGSIHDAQAEFLKTRAACGRHIACLTRAYNARIEQLNRVIVEIASHGPY